MSDTPSSAKSSLLGKFLKSFIKSPINTLFILAAVCFAVIAFGISPTLENKTIFFVIIGLWVFWFLAKQVLIILVVLGLLGGGAYLYYEYSHQEQRQCEQSGGFWNKETKTCEETVPLWEKAKRQVKRFIKKLVLESENETTKEKQQ